MCFHILLSECNLYRYITVPLDVSSGADRCDVPLAEFLEQIMIENSDGDEDGGSSSQRHERRVSSGGEAQTTTISRGDADDDARRCLRGKYLRNLQMLEWFPNEAAKLRLPGIFGANMLHDRDKVRGDEYTIVFVWFCLNVCIEQPPSTNKRSEQLWFSSISHQHVVSVAPAPLRTARRRRAPPTGGAGSSSSCATPSAAVSLSYIATRATVVLYTLNSVNP